MKKATLVALALLAAPAVVSAQSASGTVNASATVLAYLDVQQVADVDFGSIVAGDPAALLPGTSPASGTLGALRIDHNSEVAVSVTLPTGGLALVGGSGLEPAMPVTFSCGYADAASGALSGSAMACSTLANRDAHGDGSTRVSYIQIGGQIGSGDTTGRIPGMYAGSLVFTVNAVY